jgi:glucan phosphorylase
MKKLDDKKVNPNVSKMSATDTYNLYKSTASPAEKKEFEQIEERSKPLKERRVYKAKMAALDAQLKQSLSTPIPTTVTQPEPKNNFLNDLAAERKDPDLFRGLGTFLHKKI